MVYFVGAGPGAVDLITVRGRDLLSCADVIIYAGSLVNQELLHYAKRGCEIYNSAKMYLEEIVDVMVKAEKEGKLVVRLHTGDPSLYGAIKEQMDLLEGAGIPYEVCPGVSSFCGAAAALKQEYTLPSVSQSVIITRMEGQTTVPEQETLHKLAEHGCTMVLFLSMGLTEQVKQELLSGAYRESTPCAIVYKATWQDEKVVRGTVGQLPEMAKKHQITKTALIIVGDVLESDYELSKLYDAGFSTEFRKAIPKQQEQGIAILSFTEQGTIKNQKLENQLKEEGILCDTYTVEKYQRPGVQAFQSLPKLIGDIFGKKNVLLFIGATGIAVRAVAPFLKGKETDPAVLVMDEAGNHIISLLSGHLGGANEWCKKIAGLIGAEAIITTATDIRRIFAVDVFAKKNNLIIKNLESCKEVSACLLSGKQVAILSDYKLETIPKGVVLVSKEEAGQYPCGIYINREGQERKEKLPFPMTCELLLKNLYVGIGCKKGKSREELLLFLEECLGSLKISKERVAMVASIDYKAEEEGICALAKELDVPFMVFTAEELLEVEGEFQESMFVKEKVGVGNVCERAAILASKGTLIIKKTCKEGMTFALAEKEMTLQCCM